MILRWTRYVSQAQGWNHFLYQSSILPYCYPWLLWNWGHSLCQLTLWLTGRRERQRHQSCQSSSHPIIPKATTLWSRTMMTHWNSTGMMHQNGHCPKHGLSKDGSAHTDVNCRECSTSQEQDSQSKQLSMAETKSLISKLLKNCHNRVLLAMKCIMEHRCKETSELFTSYMDKVSTTVMTWHSRILPIHNQMSSCGYDKFRTHSATIRKMTDEYFVKVHILKEDLKKELQRQTEEK